VITGSFNFSKAAELLLSQVVSQEAIIRLLVKKGIFTKEEFLEVVEVVDRGDEDKEDRDIVGGV